jgi:hypothetical protein
MTNPTTPFSWQMPTASDLVTDLPADFETFGQAVATSMADLLGGTTGQVLSKASNTDMDFTWVAADDTNAIQNAIVDAKGDLIAASAADTPARLAVGNNGETLVADSSTATGLKWAAPATGMANPMTTTGDTIFSSSGSTPARRAIGTTGQVLTVSGGVPVWANPAGGGKVLQVVQGVTTTATTIATTTLTDTTLTASITPSSVSSKILVIVNSQFYYSRLAASAGLRSRLLRDATTIADYANDRFSYIEGSGLTILAHGGINPITVLDSPATTSSIIYKLQGAMFASTASGTVTFQYGSSPSSITLMEIGA